MTSSVLTQEMRGTTSSTPPTSSTRASRRIPMVGQDHVIDPIVVGPQNLLEESGAGEKHVRRHGEVPSSAQCDPRRLPQSHSESRPSSSAVGWRRSPQRSASALSVRTPQASPGRRPRAVEASLRAGADPGMAKAMRGKDPRTGRRRATCRTLRCADALLRPNARGPSGL